MAGHRQCETSTRMIGLQLRKGTRQLPIHGSTVPHSPELCLGQVNCLDVLVDVAQPL